MAEFREGWAARAEKVKLFLTFIKKALLGFNNNNNNNNKLYFHRDRVKKTMSSGTITNTF